MVTTAPPLEPSDERQSSFTAQDFQLTVGLVYILWGALIILWSRINLFVKREDIIALAQTTSALAAISLTGLTILQDRGTAQRFLRILLAAITLVFVLATTVAWISVLLITVPEFQNVRLTIGVVIGYFFVGYGVASLTAVRRELRVIGFLLPFSIPFDLAFARTDLFAVAIALSLGGMIYLLMSSAVLTLVTAKR